MSEKNINAILDRINAEHAARPVSTPSTTECTGCGVKFSESASDEDEQMYADEACDDCGTVHYDLTAIDLSLKKMDLHLGYMACESCACSHSRGS